METIQRSSRYFFEQYLGEHLDEQQAQLCGALDDPSCRRISITSGHSCGKDWFTGRAALWYHVSRFPSIVVTTGPTERQVEMVMWGEIRAAYRQAEKRFPNLPIGGMLLPNSPILRSSDNNPDHYMLGFVGKQPEAYQGLHPHERDGRKGSILIVVTEAQGIEARVYEAINSLMTADNAKLILIGNPTCEPDHEFYQSHTTKRHLYRCFRLDSEKSSHCSKEFIREMEETYGRDSATFRMRVNGIFPEDLADTLIPLAWIDRACERWATEPVGPERTLGVDVARFGSDSTCIYLGEGNRFRRVHEVQGQDLMQTAGRVGSLMREHEVEDEDVRIDDTGVGGGVTDRLRELGKKVTPINFGAEASDKEKYYNVRSEMYWLVRERFRTNRIAIDPKDVRLIRDLTAIKYKWTSSSQIQLEKKDECKKRLGYSPDRADALVEAALAADIAKIVSSSARSNLGILEYMRERAEKVKGRDSRSVPLQKTPMSRMSPEAAQLLQGKGNQNAGTQDAGAWTSVLP